MLRPEFVKSHNKPLSSDSFSNFGRLDSEIHNQEVEEATQELLQRISKISKTLTANESTHPTSILERIHEQGISLFDLNAISKMKKRNQLSTHWEIDDGNQECPCEGNNDHRDGCEDHEEVDPR